MLRDLETLPDGDLCDLITSAEALLTDLSSVVGQLKATVTHRLMNDQATIREMPEFTVKLVAQRSYEYDLPALMGLKYHLTGDQYDRTFKTVVTPNKTELNKLLKLGGAIKQIIEAAVKEVEKPPRLEITRKNIVEV